MIILSCSIYFHKNRIYHFIMTKRESNCLYNTVGNLEEIPCHMLLDSNRKIVTTVSRFCNNNCLWQIHLM